MKKIFTSALILMCSVSLVGCQNLNNQDVGTIAGGVAGGLLGSTVGSGSGQLLAIAGGTLAGAYIGGSLGRNMDRQDRMAVNAALERQPVGQPAYWVNQRTHARYTVVPMRNVRINHNEYCREYRTLVKIGDKTESMHGTACREPDGSWKPVR